MKFNLEKRAREMFPPAEVYNTNAWRLALRLTREALAAQAEEIAERCIQCSRAVDTGIYWDGYRMCGSRLASYALSLISKPEPEKTREKEMEEFVQALVAGHAPCPNDGLGYACIRCRARRLLEKKP